MNEERRPMSINELKQFLHTPPWSPIFSRGINPRLYIDAWKNMELLCWQQTDPLRRLPVSDAPQTVWNPLEWRRDLEDLDTNELKRRGLHNGTHFLLLSTYSNGIKRDLLRGLETKDILSETPSASSLAFGNIYELPATLGDFLTVYMTQRNTSQKGLARELGFSQATISNVITESRPAKRSIPQIIMKLDIDDGMKAALIDRFLNPKQKEELDLRPHRGWRDILINLSSDQLKSWGFDCVETFLMQTTINTSRKLAVALETVNQLEDRADLDELKKAMGKLDLGDNYAFTKDRYSDLLLNAWATRRLFMYTVFDDKDDKLENDGT